VLRLRVDIVEPIIASMRQRAAEQEEDVRIALSGVEHGDARVSATVEQALRTLLDNAHAYAGDGGASIRVRLAPAGPLRVAIEVEDDGIGIEAELSEKDLFANGRRGKRAKDHRPQGLGIGLFVTRQLLEGIGGTIRLVHREKPTVFRIEVPCEGGRRKP
jgi:two-component system OmpR family sensor kinase